MFLDIRDHYSTPQKFAALTSQLRRADAIFFDADDTLFKSEKVNLDQIRAIITNHARTHFSHAGDIMCCRHLKGKKPAEIVQIVGRTHDINFPPDHVSLIDQTIKRERLASYLTIKHMDRVPLFPELAEHVKSIRKPSAIVTAGEAVRAAHFLKVSGQGDIFQGDQATWLFSSHLTPKTSEYIRAVTTLSEIHGFEISPERSISFEDSPSAIEQGIRARIVIIPHTLCVEDAKGPNPEHVRMLQEVKFNALREMSIVENTVAPDGTVKKILKASDVPVITSERNFFPILTAALRVLPDRPADHVSRRREAQEWARFAAGN